MGKIWALSSLRLVLHSQALALNLLLSEEDPGLVEENRYTCNKDNGQKELTDFRNKHCKDNGHGLYI